MAAAFDVYYEGSRIFTWLSDLSGLPLDQVSTNVKNVYLCTLIDLFV
jgi:hypothetical protein